MKNFKSTRQTIPSQNQINGIVIPDESDRVLIVSVTAKDPRTSASLPLKYTNVQAIGNGSFGVVFQAKLLPSGEVVAIKKVLQDRRYKNRELEIMQSLSHRNIKDEVYLNLVLEFVQGTLFREQLLYVRARQPMPLFYVKLYMYQLFRSLAYIHMLGICHRDIKPQNLLLDPVTKELKLCDFGSAKRLHPHEPNVSYICSRYYRAPELIFGATNYTTSIDIWSAGCVMGELMLGKPMFQGENGIDQLVEIIKVLGVPTKEQILTMNANYVEQCFPSIESYTLLQLFGDRATPEAIDLLSQLLEYTPTRRLTAVEAMGHAFFDELREARTQPNGKPLPPLFDFSSLALLYFSPSSLLYPLIPLDLYILTDGLTIQSASLIELSIRPDLIRRILPRCVFSVLAEQAGDPRCYVNGMNGHRTKGYNGKGVNTNGNVMVSYVQEEN
ncbi:uncharacterized protein VTP21DRAFT_409 [Calcarisporiella thermophila]|uniref:uncharacterized protein n=1 Tax=Calcarisporiella thermophila TaxID=911321 RepID=UPI0037428D59